MNVHHLMTRELRSCGPDDFLTHPAQSMWEADVGAVPVVEDGVVVGMITDRDICIAAHTKGRLLSEIRVREVMAHSVVTCGANDSIRRVESIMQDQRVRRVPVVDIGNQLIGIVSLNDLARTAHPTFRGQTELVATLAAICEPRRPLGSAA